MKAKFSFLLLVLAFVVAVWSPMAVARNVVPAIYVFGDSTLDVGNNNFLANNPSRANFLPYSIDFPGRRPTGRFSNGYSASDYFAMKLGFRRSPPAYLSIKNTRQAVRGVNFASGGSGVFDSTNPNNSIPLSKQIRYFDQVSLSLKTHVGKKAAVRFLSKSVIYTSTANNDMFQFLARSGFQNESQQDLFIEQLINEFGTHLESLYNRGARKFIVSGTGLLGCIPLVRLSVPGEGCVEYMNGLSRKFNSAAIIALKEIAAKHRGFSYSFLNFYDFVAALTANPQKYGFTEAMAACCGSGRLNAETDCTRNATYCPNREKYFFWDRYHTTQAFSELVVRAEFDGRKYASPISIKELVRL